MKRINRDKVLALLSEIPADAKATLEFAHEFAETMIEFATDDGLEVEEKLATMTRTFELLNPGVALFWSAIPAQFSLYEQAYTVDEHDNMRTVGAPVMLIPVTNVSEEGNK